MANIGNKVFYGEYTLEHWLDLIIKGNIVLPPYQRYFVWDDEKTKKLIESIKAEEFVPPVTIGAYKERKDNKKGETMLNLIIDGQQRLTSILLAAIGYFPDRKKYNKVINDLANENDDNELSDKTSTNNQNGTDDSIENKIEWQMSSLLKGNKSLEDIENSISKGNNGFYIKIDKMLSKEDLKKYYLGFSYLVPNTDGKDNSQQKYYSTVFRNINIQGESLSVLESREALYYLHDEYKDFFHPSFLDEYKLSGLRIDFVRYLALLSQYNKNQSTYRLAYGYSKKREQYYEEYIYSIVNEPEKSIFTSIKDLVGDGDYRERIENLKESIEKIELEHNFSSIIDLDLHLFGLIYFIVFQNKKLKFDQKTSLKCEIKKKISLIKKEKDGKHKKTPSALVHIQERVVDSITIYRGCLDE